eukprot:3602893-Amphidinium_carterae.1
MGIKKRARARIPAKHKLRLAILYGVQHKSVYTAGADLRKSSIVRYWPGTDLHSADFGMTMKWVWWAIGMMSAMPQHLFE